MKTKIQELVKANGKTQQEMANYLGISQASFYAYTIGKAEPSLDKLIKIADYFDVSLDFLCGMPMPYDIPSATTEEQKQAINLILQLNAVNTVKATSYCAGLLAGQN